MDEERRWSLALVDVVHATVPEVHPPRGERVLRSVEPVGNVVRNGRDGLGFPDDDVRRGPCPASFVRTATNVKLLATDLARHWSYGECGNEECKGRDNRREQGACSEIPEYEQRSQQDDRAAHQQESGK